MNIYKKFLILILLCTAAPCSLIWSQQASAYAQESVTSSWQDLVEYAKENLPQEGYLLMKTKGFCYIKVDDQYIHALFPMLELVKEGYKEPPYFRSSEAPGAHISVFYEEENILPEEIGQVFHFELKQIVIVRPNRDTSYAVLQVSSPELEN